MQLHIFLFVKALVGLPSITLQTDGLTVDATRASTNSGSGRITASHWELQTGLQQWDHI
jgi:hypothetical protein